ncbi:MAG TPA: site-specific integrase [Ktedonobacteraceae bacterium]|nr:site-specific integrase [Ktedonobacteraceae bacterium]
MQPMHSLTMALQPPVQILKVDSVPKLMAGGTPVLPINLILKRRRDFLLAPDTTLTSLASAAQYYVEFCAHRRYGLLDVAHEEFTSFKNALLGEPFKDAEGNLVYLSGSRERSSRRVDHILQLLYGIASDIAEVYGETFDWYRYKGSPSPPPQTSGYAPPKQGSRRIHAVRWEQTKITGLPDEQFVKLLQAAKTRWEDHIPRGDLAFAAHPEKQRGALFYRNVALLFVLRYAGSRRSEANQLHIADVDRKRHLISLVTKGHHGKRLPVVLYQPVEQAIWLYVTRFRPSEAASSGSQERVFLSHSVRNYGYGLTSESVRALVDTLRGALDPPWNEHLTPHMLRHAFGYELQRMGGPSLVTANMRHASLQSGDAYAAGAEVFVDDILSMGNRRVLQLLKDAQMGKEFPS